MTRVGSQRHRKKSKPSDMILLFHYFGVQYKAFSWNPTLPQMWSAEILEVFKLKLIQYFLRCRVNEISSSCPGGLGFELSTGCPGLW